MDERGGRLRISLQDLRPVEDVLDTLDTPREADPLPPPPPVGGGPSLVLSTPLPADPGGEGSADDATAEFASGATTDIGPFAEKTLLGKGPPGTSDESVIADRYVIEEPIGEGGMGRVFRVRHKRLGKSFALKLMQKAFSGDSRARELFYREARLASALAHPNIVSIIDFGEDPSRGAFMVMELLVGETLASRLRQEGRFSIKSACDVILQVAEALHYIHKRQIVHCDIKPDNILLVNLGTTGRRRYGVKLLDFGLARIGTGASSSSAVIDGTPEYMAPERILGRSPQSSMDIYGLGVLSYEILTGRPPFLGKLSSLLQDHVHTPPPPFPPELKKTLDERAEALVMKALAKDPADRQKDMAAFLYELRTLMDMLGFGRRRRGVQGSQVQRGSNADLAEGRKRAAAAGFDLCPLPMAGLNVDGQIVVANSAFRQFVMGDASMPMETSNIHGTRFIEVHPGLSADLRRVHVSAEPITRILHLKLHDRSKIRLKLWLTPGSGEAGEIQMAVHALDE